MSVKATGQITLVDLTDGQLSVYLSSNLSKTQIYNKKENSFSPDWRETNLQIVPNVSLNQSAISLDKVTVNYKKLIMQEEIELDGTKEKVQNGILTINTNLLNELENKSVTYIAYLQYENFSARADITFTLLNEGVDGTDGTSGESGYTFILTNESYLFKGDNNSALNDYVNTTLSAYQGATEQKIKIISVNGKSASIESVSTGIEGLNFKVSTLAESVSPIITFTSTTNLTQKNGTLPITFQMKGQTWTKFFSYGIALQGKDAISYWMINNTGAIKKSEENEFSPNQIILEAKNNTGVQGVSDYYARFLIEGSVDNKQWEPVYTSNQNEKTIIYNISNIDYISYRCSMFLADNTNILLDRQIIPVVSDGKTGIDGMPGKDGISTYFYVKYSANKDGSNMTDLPQTDTKYLGVCSTNAQTAPTSPNAYTWSETKGKDGINGTPGEAGQDGQSSYLHIKYSNDGLTFTGNSGEDLGLYIGTLVDFNEQDSTTFSDYTWKKFVGNDAKSLTLYSSTYVVSYDSYGKLKDKELITLTAVQQNFEDEVTWTTNPEVTLGSTGLTRTLNPSVFDNIDKVTVTITSSTFTDTVTINKITDGNNSNSIGARSSNYNAIDKESAVFINGEKVASLITSEANRGHTLYRIDKDSLLLKSSKTYDTYGNPNLATTLANDILKITDDIIVIITCDASTVNEDLRNALKTIGGLEKGTWAQQRVSQYVIGMPGIGPNKGYEQFSTDVNNTLITAVPVIIGTGIILNGTNAYTHIKYSNDGGKTFTHPDSIVSRDINDWISGDYNMKTGIYEENPNRICIPGLIKVEKNVDYYFNTYNSNYRLILRIYNNNKEFIESRSGIGNGGLSLITYDGYFGISLYSPTKTVKFEDYVKEFEEGTLIPTVCLETKSGMGDSKGKYFGVYYDNNSEDSTNPSSYVWNQIVSDEVEIPEVTPPQNNYSVILTNESQTIYADNEGNVSSEEIKKIQSEVKVFNGTEECLTGTSGKNKWEKIIWNNLKTESDGLGTDVKRCILPLTTKFTTDKIQLLSALSTISTTTIDDYVVPNSNYHMEGERSFYIGKITTYLYCSRDYNVTHKMFHDDGMTLKINDKIIFYKGHVVFEDYVPLSFQKGYNKIEIYWTQWGGINGVGLYGNKLSTLDFVDKMDCYGYKHYDLSIKSQTPNIGAKINSTKTGFIATSIPKDIDSGNVVLTVTMFDGTTIDKEFNWTKSKKGDTGKNGNDGLTVILTNENHSFPATTDAAVASSTSTKILAFKGAQEVPIKIKTVNGKTVSTTSMATGITGLNFSVSSIDSVNEPTINFSASTSLTTTNGTLPVVMEINGQTITKNFSFSLALKGINGTSVTISSTSITYQVSTSGTVKPTGEWNTTIPSVPNGQYLWTKTTVEYSDGTTTDSYSVAYKGTNGTKGENGTSTYTYIKYASNSTGSDMSDNSTNKTYIGVYTGTSATAPTSASSYTWSKFKGDTGATGATGADGKDGNGIKTISYYYKVTTTQTPPEASTITSTTIPSLSSTNKYLWQKEIIDFSDSTTADKVTVSLLAVYGNTGAKGENGQKGEDAYLVDINPSSQIFKSTDGGTTFSPDTITLTPRFQNVSFGSWQYSTNGGTTWTTITNTTTSTTNCYYNSSTKILTIPKGFTGYTDKITSIVFKCVGSISTVYDTITIAKLYDVTDLEVGGRNFLISSNKMSPGSPAAGITTSVTTEGFLKIVSTKGNNNYLTINYLGTSLIENNFKEGDYFTFSIEIKSDNSTSIPTIYFKNGMGYYQMKGVMSTTFSKIYYTGTWKKANSIALHLGFSSAIGTFYIKNFKFESGKIATDWTPAPEDIESELKNKVEREHIKAAINASEETVKIEATNVNLEGYVTITSLSGKSQTTIDGSNITTGVLKSANYNGKISDSVNTVGSATSGMAIKLTNGIIDTKNFSLDSSGNIALTGRIYSRGRALQMLDDRFVVYNDDNLPVMELKSNGQTFYNDDGNEISRFSYQTVQQNEDLRPIEDADLLTGKTIQYNHYEEGSVDPNNGMNLGEWVDFSKINNNTTIVYLNQEKSDSKLRIAFFKDATYMYLRFCNGNTTIIEFYAENLSTHNAKSQPQNFTINSTYTEAYAFYTKSTNKEIQNLIKRFKNHYIYYGDRRVFNFNLTGETNNEFSWTKNDEKVLSIRTTSVQSLGNIGNLNVFECNAELATIASTLILPYKAETGYGKYAGGISPNENGFSIVSYDYNLIKNSNLDHTLAMDFRGIDFNYKNNLLWLKGWDRVLVGGADGTTLGICPHVLYNNASGTQGSITLSEPVANFDYLEVFYRDYDGTKNQVTLMKPASGDNFLMIGGYMNTDSWETGNLKYQIETLTKRTVYMKRGVQLNYNKSNTYGAQLGSASCFITTVIGYK